jgi:aspartate 1-decarboxylase
MDGFFRKMLLAKIHGATITHADIAYEGSITIPADLLDASGLLPHEGVCVWDVTNGARFETYILRGEPGSRAFHVNGAAARLVSVGDRIIIAGCGLLPNSQALVHTPTVVFMTPDNLIKDIRSEVPGKVVGE